MWFILANTHSVGFKCVGPDPKSCWVAAIPKEISKTGSAQHLTGSEWPFSHWKPIDSRGEPEETLRAWSWKVLSASKTLLECTGSRDESYLDDGKILQSLLMLNSEWEFCLSNYQVWCERDGSLYVCILHGDIGSQVLFLHHHHLWCSLHCQYVKGTGQSGTAHLVGTAGLFFDHHLPKEMALGRS